MKVSKINKNIIDTIPSNLLDTSEELKTIGITAEIKLAYYLYRQLTKKVLEADIDFHVADKYEQKQHFFKKNFNQIANNKVLCKHINQAYKHLLKDCVEKHKEKGISLDIQSEIEYLHPENEITHSDIILICNGRPIFCNPILDLLESKAEYRIKYFARSLEENPYPFYQKRLYDKYGEFYSITPETREKLDTEIGQNFNGIYRDEFEEKLFQELDNSSYTSIYTESGLYPYLKNNKHKYNLEDTLNLQKSKVDFILDNLSYICSDDTEINVMTKYLYYIRLIRRVFKETSIGDYNILTCKYKNGNPADVELLLLLNLADKKFSYILPSNADKFREIPLEKLKLKIRDKKNPLVLYNRPYKIETGPLTKEESNCFIDEPDRD